MDSLPLSSIDKGQATMTIVHPNEYTGEYDLVDDVTGEVVESVTDLYAARSLCRMHNEGE